MIAEIALAATLLRDHLFSLRLPPDVTATRHIVGFETDAYRIRDAAGNALLDIVVGGGVWDIKGSHTLCLHGHIVRIKSDANGFVLVGGNSGFPDAVSIAYAGKDHMHLGYARSIAMTLRMNAGSACHS